MEREEIERSGGNVFADLGLENPEELMLQAELALAIQRTIRSEEQDNAVAARKMGLTLEELSRIIDHPFDTTIGRLLTLLNQLGQSVQLVVYPRSKEEPKVTVRGGREQAAA